MSLRTLFSGFCLFTGFIFASPTIDIIYQNHLETASGRAAFLVEKLGPYVDKVGQMNDKISALAEEIKTLSPQDDQQKILTLTEEMTQKMGQLLTMMPVLEMIPSIDQDFQVLDALLHQKDPLSFEEQQIIDRIASLCNFIEKS